MISWSRILIFLFFVTFSPFQRLAPPVWRARCWSPCCCSSATSPPGPPPSPSFTPGHSFRVSTSASWPSWRWARGRRGWARPVCWGSASTSCWGWCWSPPSATWSTPRWLSSSRRPITPPSPMSQKKLANLADQGAGGTPSGVMCSLDKTEETEAWPPSGLRGRSRGRGSWRTSSGPSYPRNTRRRRMWGSGLASPWSEWRCRTQSEDNNETFPRQMKQLTFQQWDISKHLHPCLTFLLFAVLIGYVLKSNIKRKIGTKQLSFQQMVSCYISW